MAIMNKQFLYKMPIFISMIFLLSGALYADNPLVQFSHAAQFTLNTGTNGATLKNDLKNLAVLIKLDQNNFDFNTLKEKLIGDIRFSLNGSYLSYKVKSWNKSAKTAEIWVIVPIVLRNNSTQSITMTWGKSKQTITDQKIKNIIEAKEAHEDAYAGSGGAPTNVFHSSPDIYGVWTVNSANGFTLVYE